MERTATGKGLQVAICGGGIAGMSLAAFLAKSWDIEVHLFESNPEIRTIGAGLAVWKRFWDILENNIDFEKQCTSRGLQILPWPKVRGPVLRKSDVSPSGKDFSQIPHGPRMLPRDVFLDILYTHAKNGQCRIHTNKKMKMYAEDASGRLTLLFEDGAEFTADILIGADGVHSRVRQRMFMEREDLSQPQFSGQFAYRMRCPIAEVERKYSNNASLNGFKIWCGRGRHVTSNIVRDEIQMTAYDNQFDEDGNPPVLEGPWVAEVPSSQIAQRYVDWELDLTDLLSIPKVASRWAIHVVAPLPTFAMDRVCLIGDAAHAMTPHQGLGGCQGVEDAYILARLLEHPGTTVDTLPQVLKIYDCIRRPASQAIARQSFANGLTYGLFGKRVRSLSLDELGKELVASCFWLLEKRGAEKEWLKAEAMLSMVLENGDDELLPDFKVPVP